MSSWFDKLLEELQRRQAEADAQREGRPFEPRGSPRAATSRPSTRGGGGRRRTGGNGADGGSGGGGNGGGEPSRRSPAATSRGGATSSSAAGSSSLLIVLGLLGGAVNLITDVMWYDELGRRDVLDDPAVGAGRAVRHRLRRDARARAGQHLAGAADRAAGAGAPARRHRDAGRVALDRHRAHRRRRPPGPRLGRGVERQLGDGPALPQRRGVGARPTRRSAATSASTSSTCRSGASSSAGRRRRSSSSGSSRWGRTRRGRCAGSST